MYHPRAARLPIIQLPLWPEAAQPNEAAQLLRALAVNGMVESLFDWVAEHNSDYPSAWRLVRYLHRAGHLHLWTRPGYPSVMVLPETALPSVPVRLRHDPDFRGLVVGRAADGTALVMVRRRGHTDHPKCRVAHIPYKSLVAENTMDENKLQLLPHPRPLPEKHEVEFASKVAAKIAKLGPQQREGVILTFVLENMSLLAEVNAHRAARGFEPIELGKVQGV